MATGLSRHAADEKAPVIQRLVNAVAPIRICDIGGWTDTWFAKHGAIFNIAVYPYVEVQVGRTADSAAGSISIGLENYNRVVLARSPEHHVRRPPSDRRGCRHRRSATGCFA